MTFFFFLLKRTQTHTHTKMQQKNLYPLLVYLILINCVNSTTVRLKSTDYCRHRSTANITAARQHSDCTDHLMYGVQCSHSYCATSKYVCNNTVATFLSQLGHFHLLSVGFNLTTSLSRFYSNINECPADYAFKASHVCIRGNNCGRLELRRQTGLKYHDDYGDDDEDDSLVWKKVKCVCPAVTHAFECGRIVCAKHLMACHYFQTNKSIKLKKC